MKQLLLFITIFLPVVGLAKIDRRQVLTRNNPHVNAIDSLASLSVGNGHFAFTVDATGLQTFPETYRNGIPLGTIGFDIPQGAAADIQDIDQTLELWDGLVKSRFAYRGVSYEVETEGDAEKCLVEIYDEAGAKVGECDGAKGKIEIKNVHLWQPLNAYLYNIKVTSLHHHHIKFSHVMHLEVSYQKPVSLGCHESDDCIFRFISYHLGLSQFAFLLMLECWHADNHTCSD